MEAEIHKSLKEAIKNWCNEQQKQRDRLQSISNHECSIRWLNEQLTTKKLSQANIAEYKHQIKYHEINLAFLY